MHSPAPRCLLAAAAVALALAQHFGYVAAATLIDNFNQNIWLVLNTAEAAVLFCAMKMLAARKKIAALLGVVGAALTAAIVVSTFVAVLPDAFWAPMSTAVIFALIVAAVYLTKNDPA